MSWRAVEAARARSLRAGVLADERWPSRRVAATERPRVELLGQQLPHGPQPPAFDILYWNNDTTPPGGLASDFLDLYLTNGLVEGTLELLGTPVDLGKVSCDSFVVAGYTDHLIPWDGAYQTTQLLGGEPVRAQQRRSHPGDPQPAGQPEGVLPHVRLAAGDRRPMARRATQVTGSWWTLWRLAPPPRAPRGRGAPVRATRPTRRSNPHPGATSTCSAGAAHLRPRRRASLRVSVRGDGRPILLIMGLGGNIEMWDPLERELHARGFQTIAYDAPGTGHSPPQPRPAAATRPRPPGCPPPGHPRPARRPRARRVVRGRPPRSWPCATPTGSAG